ncbi:F-box only protein 6-like [Coccinella septempunctata]|uniref:F-box only protein 6-like n=1 Tax=Coccinella septempunctata TaxID=41139 RepID=UPI001D0775FF|nr:F-box only protein 6-like [Coccinella septempunctata]
MGSMYSYDSYKNSNMNSNQSDMIEALDFNFPDDDLENGLYLSNIYLPEEIIIHILSFVSIRDILKLRLVCKKWYNLLKTHSLWSTIFLRIGRKSPRQLPWYVCYKCLDNSILDKNLLKNNCGQEKFKHWIILEDGGHRMKVEETPIGSDPIPNDIPDFNGAKSCFVTSFTSGTKVQMIQIQGNLSKYIIKKFKPHIYISEWYAGRFDCGGHYELKAIIYRRPKESTAQKDGNNEGQYPINIEDEIILERKKEIQFGGNEAAQWQKVEIVIEDYPDDIEGILFEHKARDNQFWAGHYGPKMAGGVVKFLSDSLGH